MKSLHEYTVRPAKRASNEASAKRGHTLQQQIQVPISSVPVEHHGAFLFIGQPVRVVNPEYRNDPIW